MDLPRGYLSPSQIALVLQNPKQYVKQYIHGEAGWTSEQQKFGSMIHNILEGRAKTPKTLLKKLSDVPKYKKHDVEIKTLLKRKAVKLELLGRLDGLGINQGEYKTGMIPWTQRKANESLQLRIYALIEYKNTKEIPNQKLSWLQSEWKGEKIILTGQCQTFHVKHDLKTMLETEALVWRAYDRIISLLTEEYSKI